MTCILLPSNIVEHVFHVSMWANVSRRQQLCRALLSQEDNIEMASTMLVFFFCMVWDTSLSTSWNKFSSILRKLQYPSLYSSWRAREARFSARLNNDIPCNRLLYYITLIECYCVEFNKLHATSCLSISWPLVVFGGGGGGLCKDHNCHHVVGVFSDRPPPPPTKWNIPITSKSPTYFL